MIVGVLKESCPGERRVALTPEGLPSLAKAGLQVLLEAGAGSEAGFPDSAYQEKGARIAQSREEVCQSAEVLACVRGLGSNPEGYRGDLGCFRSGQVLIGFLDPLGQPEAVREAAEKGLTAFSLELIPRITRAQNMDALSSMAMVAGYKAVLLGAAQLPRMFPMLMTAAGMVHPARVLVIGAGVAGLQAIATARRLGAVVHGYDIRPAAREEIQSLGAKAVELPLEAKDAQDSAGYAKAMDEDFYRRQAELMGRIVTQSDVVITTAVVPGRQAPVLITRDMVWNMAPGSVIVDLAADRAGNCELTQPGETVVVQGVAIMGPLNLPSSVPCDASHLLAKNISNFLVHLVKDKKLSLNLEDEIIRETLVAQGGQVAHPRLRELLGLDSSAAAAREKS